MKEIIVSLVAGLLTGFMAIVLLTAGSSSYGLAITPVILAAAAILVVVAELVKSSSEEKTFYGLIFHTVAVLVVFIFAWSHGMLGGYTYHLWDYHSGVNVSEVQVKGWEWIVLFSVYFIRLIIEGFIKFFDMIKISFDDLDIDIKL